MDFLINKLLEYLLKQPDNFAKHSDIEKELNIDSAQLKDLLIDSDRLFDFHLDSNLSVVDVSLTTKGLSQANKIKEDKNNQNKSDFKNNFSYPVAAQLTVNVLVFFTGLLIGYLMK